MNVTVTAASKGKFESKFFHMVSIFMYSCISYVYMCMYLLVDMHVCMNIYTCVDMYYCIYDTYMICS